MDAWEILISNSSLGSGHDAWEHLNAQEGGTGGCDCSLCVGASEANTIWEATVNVVTIMSAHVTDETLSANIDTVLSSSTRWDADAEVS